MFFHNVSVFVIAHWFALLLMYLVVMNWTAIRFASAFEGCKWYKKVRWYTRKKKNNLARTTYPLRYLPPVACLIVGYLIAIPFFLIFRWRDFTEWREEKEYQKKQAEADKQKEERAAQIATANQYKARKRKEWLAANNPTLHFNTVEGITTVLRPAEYEQVKRASENARTNELWEHDTYMPAPEGFTFVTKSGGELVRRYSEHARKYKVAGWLSEVREIAQEANCKLVRDEKIFVPWVNETLVSFDKQAQTLKDRHNLALRFELIDKQAPDEFQPET